MSTLSPEEQELFDLAKGTIPRFFFQKKTAPQEILGGAAKTFAAAKKQIASWFSMTYIKDAVNFWEDQHAKDRGIRRQNNEADAALAARIRAYPDALTIPALLGVVNNILTAAGYPATASIVEARAAGAYYQDESLPSLQAYFGRGNRWSSRRHNLIVFLPPGTDAATQASCFAALNKWKAGGIGVVIEVGSATGAYQRVTVTPPAKIINVTDSPFQFAAQMEKTDTVTWKVNGVAGGNSTYGTISAAGLYTPPAATPFPEDVEVQAVSTLDATVIGRARVKVISTPLLPYAPEVLADSPYFFWRLGSASYTGATEADSTGNGHTGTISGSYSASGTGGPLHSSTDNQGYTSISAGALQSPALSLTGHFSIEFWHHGGTVFGGGIFDTVGDVAGHFLWARRSDGAVRCGFDDGLNFSFTTDLPTVNANADHHHVFTWDGTNGRYYFDGALVATKAMTGPTAAITEMSIGRYTGAAGINVFIAGMAFYNGAVLSAARVLDHYLAGTGQLH